MIWDGYWKRELKQAISTLRWWRVIASICPSGWAEHQINQAILYSAIIIRKMAEAERDAKNELVGNSMPLPDFPLLGREVPVLTYPYVGDAEFVVQRVIPEDYDSAKVAEDLKPLGEVCNQMIHSYVWSIAYAGKSPCGVMVSSEHRRKRCAYLLRLDDWVEAVQFCLDKSVLA